LHRARAGSVGDPERGRQAGIVVIAGLEDNLVAGDGQLEGIKTVAGRRTAWENLDRAGVRAVCGPQPISSGGISTSKEDLITKDRKVVRTKVAPERAGHGDLVRARRRAISDKQRLETTGSDSARFRSSEYAVAAKHCDLSGVKRKVAQSGRVGEFKRA